MYWKIVNFYFVGRLLIGQRRMEATLASILKKVETNEERLDLLVKAGGSIDLDDAEDDAFLQGVSFPIKKETDFKTLNDRLNLDAAFRNKFVSFLTLYVCFDYSYTIFTRIT